MRDELMLFALDATRVHGEDVARELGMTLSPHEEREFEDGEHKTRPLVSVRGRDVYVMQSLYADPKQSVSSCGCSSFWARSRTPRLAVLRRSFPISRTPARTARARRAIR